MSNREEVNPNRHIKREKKRVDKFERQKNVLTKIKKRQVEEDFDEDWRKQVEKYR